MSRQWETKGREGGTQQRDVTHGMYLRSQYLVLPIRYGLLWFKEMVAKRVNHDDGIFVDATRHPHRFGAIALHSNEVIRHYADDMTPLSLYTTMTCAVSLLTDERCQSARISAATRGK